MIKSEMGNEAFYTLLSKEKRDDFEEGFIFRCQNGGLFVGAIIRLAAVKSNCFILGYLEANNHFKLREAMNE